MKKNNQKIFLLGLIGLVLLIFLVKIYTDLTNKSPLIEDSQEKIGIEKIENLNEIEENEKEEIFVHVCGRVKNPGLIKLNNGARIIDAVETAGGMFEDADIDNINLAKKVHDEDRIYIPKIGENQKEDFLGEKDKININLADRNALMSLPGIGEKTAKKIIDYRKENGFKTIEDLKNIPSIGDKKFEELKNFICVN